MKGHHINKLALSDEMNVDKRTIQRDIDNIRNHFYDSDEYGGRRLNIVYSHIDNSYYLEGYKNQRKAHTFKYLLLMIRSFTHTLNHDIYQLLESQILNQYQSDRETLYSILSTFKIHRTVLPTENLDQFMNAIKYSISISMNNSKNLQLPLALNYKMGDFHALTLDKRKIEQYNLTHCTFTSTSQSQKPPSQLVTFEIERSYWELFKARTDIITIEDMSDHAVIASIQASANDVQSICFQNPPFVRLIGPKYLKKMIEDQLISLNKIYLSQSVSDQ